MTEVVFANSLFGLVSILFAVSALEVTEVLVDVGIVAIDELPHRIKKMSRRETRW